jgi:hypothetical protein
VGIKVRLNRRSLVIYIANQEKTAYNETKKDIRTSECMSLKKENMLF